MDFSLLEMWQSMGFAARLVIFVLLGMSVYVAAISVERWRAFDRGRKSAAALAPTLASALGGKGALAAARSAAAAHRDAPSAAVIDLAAAAYDKRARTIGAMELAAGVKAAAARGVESETAALKRGLGGLATIASTAPFVGLFGTVVGIINAFQQMAATGTGGLASVSAGISEALVTTAFGLLVAIPAVGLYNYFSSVVDDFVVDMESAASSVVEHVLLADD